MVPDGRLHWVRRGDHLHPSRPPELFAEIWSGEKSAPYREMLTTANARPSNARGKTGGEEEDVKS